MFLGPVSGSGEVMKKVRQAYLKPIHINAYRHRSGKYGLITGFYLIVPDKGMERPCLSVVFEDGEIDYVPLSEVNNGVFRICESSNEDRRWCPMCGEDVLKSHEGIIMCSNFGSCFWVEPRKII